MPKKKTNTNKPGPDPETLNVEGDVDWTDAMKHAMNKPKPKDGWPESKGDEERDKGSSSDRAKKD